MSLLFISLAYCCLLPHLRPTASSTLQPKGVDFGYFFRLELSVRGPNALQFALEILEDKFGLGRSVTAVMG